MFEKAREKLINPVIEKKLSIMEGRDSNDFIGLIFHDIVNVKVIRPPLLFGVSNLFKLIESRKLCLRLETGELESFLALASL